MIKVQGYKINKDANSFVAAIEDRLLFTLPKPTIIQPSEIIKIPTGVVMKVPAPAIITIVTHPDLAKKVCELFPGVTVVDVYFPEEELQLAVKNSGRNQINLMQGDMLAAGYVTKVQDIEVEEFEPDVVAHPERRKTKPQKKNPFNFEVK